MRKIVKQGIIWFSNIQIRYFKDLCEPCLNAPERARAGDSSMYEKWRCSNAHAGTRKTGWVQFFAN